MGRDFIDGGDAWRSSRYLGRIDSDDLAFVCSMRDLLETETAAGESAIPIGLRLGAASLPPPENPYAAEITDLFREAAANAAALDAETRYRLLRGLAA